MKKIISIVLVVLGASLSFPEKSQALTIVDFTEGTSSPFWGDTYSSIGMSSSNFRFSTWSGDPGDDFPFTDFKGTVIDSGKFPDLIGRISFDTPIDFLELDGVINNSNFSNTVEWNVTAFDINNSQVDFVSSGLFDPNDQNGSLHIFSTLKVEAPGAISNIFINQQAPLGQHKGWGLDTLRVEGALQPNAVPEPTTMILFGSGLAGAFVRHKRRS